MSNNVHFSSASVEWATPDAFFEKLDNEFHFTLDTASTDENAKCERHFTERDGGLEQSWDGEVIWCNPPYGRVISSWVKKASEAKSIVVMLLPARTDTRWFHDYIYGKAEIRFVKGRLKFGGHANNAPFPNMVVVFRNA